MSGTSDNALWMQRPEVAAALRRRRMGEQLMQQGSDASPIQSPWQGLARLAQGLIGGYQQGRADDDLQSADAARKARIAEILRGGQPAPATGGAPGQWSDTTPQPMTAPQQPAQGAMPAWGSPELIGMVTEAAQKHNVPLGLALAMIRNESSGQPGAVGDSGKSVGLGQIQEATARNPGYGVAPMDPALRTDPRANLDFAMRYFTAKGAHLGATDLNNPEHQDIALRGYNGGGDPNYVRNVRRYMPQSGAQPGGDLAIPAQMPGQPQGQPGGATPAPRTPDAAQHYTQQAEMYERQAQALEAEGEHGMATFKMQQAAGARQMALARAPQPDADERLMLASGLQPGTPEYRAAAQRLLDKKGNPTTVVNTGENYAQRKAIDDWGVAKTAATDTARRGTLFDTATQVLDSGAFKPGATADMRLKFAQFFQDLGVDTNAPAGEVLKAVQRQLELANTPKGQGQITENERVLIREMMPLMTNSEEGIRMLIEATKLLDKRDQDVFRIYNDSARKNQGLPSLVDVNEAIANLPPALPPQMVQRFSLWKEGAPAPLATPTGQGGGTQGGGWSIKPKQ